jgi:hypothetical protein
MGSSSHGTFRIFNYFHTTLTDILERDDTTFILYPFPTFGIDVVGTIITDGK